MATKRKPKSTSDSQTYDVISIGAHPDDVEVGTGGVLCKLHDLGYKTGIIYLTEGEMGTGGNRAIRKREGDGWFENLVDDIELFRRVFIIF